MVRAVFISAVICVQIIFAAPSFCAENGSLLRKGVGYFDSKNYKSAVYYFEKINTSYILYDFAEYYRGLSFEKLNQYKKAIACFEAFISQQSNSSLYVKALYSLGMLCEKIGDINSAYRYYTKIICENNSGSVFSDARQRLIRIIKDKGWNYPEGYADAVYKQGIELFENNKYEQARFYFREIATKFPKNARAGESLLYLAKSEYLCGSRRDAVKLFSLITSWGGDSGAQAYYYLGRIYGDIRYYETVINYFPESSVADDAEYRIGYYYEYHDNFPSAISAYEKFERNYKNSNFGDEVLWRLGKLYYKFGNYSRAAETFGKGAQQYPHSGLADACLYWKAMSQEKLGNKDEAKKTYELVALTYDKTYYANRAEEKIGLRLKRQYPKTVFSSNINFTKFYELKSLKLFSQALQEANIISNPSVSKIASSSIYYDLGRFDLAIANIDALCKKYTTSPSSESLPSEVWKIYYPIGFSTYVYKYSKLYGVDPYIVFALIREESRYNEEAASWARAYGLTQIIPSTGRRIAKQMKIRHFSAKKLFDPHLSIKMGTFHIADLITQFSGNKILALASYNAGAHNVKKWINKYGYSDMDEFVENIPFRETRLYVKKVMSSYYEYKRIYGEKELLGVYLNP